MRNSYERATAEQTGIQREIMQGTAEIRSCAFGLAWKGIFKHKAAEELAVRGCMSLRAAASQLSGEHETSAKSIAALIEICVPRNK